MCDASSTRLRIVWPIAPSTGVKSYLSGALPRSVRTRESLSDSNSCNSVSTVQNAAWRPRHLLESARPWGVRKGLMPEREEDRYQRCLDQAKQASSGGRFEEALAWVSEALRANP